MSSIQDIHALEERIYDIVQEFVDGLYYRDDVLAISKRCGRITLKADALEAIKVGKTTEVYPFTELVCPDENNMLVPDNDKISEIANSWMFLN